MTIAACTLCARSLQGSERVCTSCGASIAWLAAAPAMLREKLGRTARRGIGAATVAMMLGACSDACATLDSGQNAPADAGVDGGTTP